MFRKFANKIAKNKRGNVLALTSLAAPVAIGFAGLSVDVGYGLYSKSQLRGAAELTALDIAEKYTAPNNFSISNGIFRNHDPLKVDALSLSKEGLPESHNDAAIKLGDIEIGEWDVESKVFTPGTSGPIVNAVRVKGELSEERKNRVSTFFGKFFEFSPDLHAESFAIAPLVPSFHFLNPTESGALQHSDGTTGDRTDLDIGDVWINSDADDALLASPVYAKFGAPAAFIKGGSTLSRDNYFEDVFRLPDLLAAHPEPARPVFSDPDNPLNGCDYNNLEFDSVRTVILWPGAYCGGLKIKESDIVYFVPGEYQFLDGPLEIDLSPLVYGRGVFLHFDGAGAAMDIMRSNLYLSAPIAGINKGILLFSSRSTTNGIAHEFTLSRTEFKGTFYAPDNHVSVVNSLMNGACHSLCLVADTMSVTDNSFLNWYHTFKQFTYFNDVPRVAPTVLEPYMSPYLISS